MGNRTTQAVVSSRRTPTGKRLYTIAGEGFVVKTPGRGDGSDRFERFDVNGMFLFEASSLSDCLDPKARN